MIIQKNKKKINKLKFKFKLIIKFEIKILLQNQIEVQQDQLSQEIQMNRQKSTTRKSSTYNTTSKQKITNKKQLSDTIYLMQNQNQILKLKNQQLSYKLDSLNIQLKQRTQRVSQVQKQCQSLKQIINQSIFIHDIQLENQKKLLLDKINLAQQNILIYQDKIHNARKQVVYQQNKIPLLINDKHHFEEQLRISKMENQGSKKILLNLQQQNQQLRQRNHQLSLKKYSKEPQQKAISQEIQQRIRLIKNINLTQRVLKKQKISHLIADLLLNIFQQRKKLCFLNVEKHGLKKALIKKKLFMLAHIRKNYLNSIKNRVMSIFRQPLKPIQQEQKCVRILQEIRKRRQKARMWRIWRNQTAKAEYSLIRKYESQNTIQKICKTIQKSVLISCFNQLKYYNNNYRTQISASKIYSTINKQIQQLKLWSLNVFKQCQRSYQIQQEIQKSAQQQSQMLVLSRMFYGWVELIKQKRKQSLAIKYKYFKRFKKIFVIRKRNVLNEMLGESKIKINDINLKSICFSALKQQLYSIKEQRTIQQNDKISNTLKQLKDDTQNRLKFDIQLDKQIALLKIGKYLQRKAKQALQIWKKQHDRVSCVQKMYSIFVFNLQKNINYAFSRIQIRRFEKLKISIKQKIESCDYSYNYLVKQNLHIKQVLDKKSHELQKAKFTSILQRLIRKQKQIKHKYLYKFLKNGYKYWKIKKSLSNIDLMLTKKIKIIFLFLLQHNKIEKIQQEKINYYTERHDTSQINNLLKYSIKGFKQTVQKNKRMRRALAGIFDRNLQINFYQAFAKMRNQSYLYQIRQINTTQSQIQFQINTTNENITNTEQIISILTERLKNKQQTFKQRKIMSLYKFYLKNIKSNVGYYIHKWYDKIQQENRIIKFTQLLNRKNQSFIKTKFLFALTKTKSQLQKQSLQTKLQRSKNQLQNAETNFIRFENQSNLKIQSMQTQNLSNEQITQEFEKRTQHMNNVKVQAALKHRQKFVFQVALKVWRKQKDQFIQKWTKINKLFSTYTIRDAFQELAYQIKNRINKDRIKSNLSRIYHKTYKETAGLGFRIWRNINIMAKVRQSQAALKQAMKGMQHIEAHYQLVKRKYNQQTNHRIGLWKLRRITNQWRIYTQKKIHNNQKKTALQKWLRVGYSVQTINLFKRFKNKSLGLKIKIFDFQTKIQQRNAKAFLKQLHNDCLKKHTIQKLFMQKFCFYQIQKLNQQFFTKVKNYYRQKLVNQKDRKTFCLQKVINCFQKKRKDILCQNMRMWKRNMYLMNIQKNLLKRVVRKAMNTRVKDLFYSWKLQTQARFMVRQHISQGQVKKRQVQIKRLKKYLDQYKKEKGLLLQNQEGNFVVSPRFQQNKQKQLKRQNLLKYRFISRLILSMNGYQAPVKSWNNLQLFTKLRLKCQKAALMIKNRMQKGDLYTSFKIWQNGVIQLRKMFNDMERKDLIRILNKQKDKMQMDYSRKVEVEEKVERQLRRYKVLSYQDKRKQRICAQILFREARKVKLFAFDTWRKRVEQIKDEQAYDLQERGNNKIMSIEVEIHQLERQHLQAQQHNRMLKQAVEQALQLAEMIKRITQQRDKLKRQLTQSNISCENLQQQNQQLNNKLILAQKQAINLLTLSEKGI